MEKVCSPEFSIDEYIQSRDEAAVLAIIRENRSSLIARPDFNEQKMLRQKTVEIDRIETFNSANIKVARHNNKTIGFGLYSLYEKDDCLVAEGRLLAMQQEYRNKGYARALILHLILDAQKKGAQKLCATTRKSNEPAVHLYTSLARSLPNRELIVKDAVIPRSSIMDVIYFELKELNHKEYA